mmetsp:Transcript_159482/g.511741  ORF Transcript_159482/g.511741 Transcript_159482/m.511741 type:complete len:263 (+) Transcript_159482:737-1525(+)
MLGNGRAGIAEAFGKNPRQEIHQLLAGTLQQLRHNSASLRGSKHFQERPYAVSEFGGVFAGNESFDSGLDTLSFFEFVKVQENSVEQRQQHLAVLRTDAIEFLLLPVGALCEDWKELQHYAGDHCSTQFVRSPQAPQANQEFPRPDTTVPSATRRAPCTVIGVLITSVCTWLLNLVAYPRWWADATLGGYRSLLAQDFLHCRRHHGLRGCWFCLLRGSGPGGEQSQRSCTCLGDAIGQRRPGQGAQVTFVILVFQDYVAPFS